MIRTKALVGTCICFAVVSAALAGPPIITVDVLKAAKDANKINTEIKIDPDGETLKFYKIYVIPKEGGPGRIHEVNKPDPTKEQKKVFEDLKAGKYTVIFEVAFGEKPDGSWRSTSKRENNIDVTGGAGDNPNLGILKGNLTAVPGVKITATYTPPVPTGWKLTNPRFVARHVRSGTLVEQKKTGEVYAEMNIPDRGDWDFWVYGDAEKNGKKQGLITSSIGFAKIP